MSFKGEIEAQCPSGCESFRTDIWSYIRADNNPELREALLYRELNLLICPQCGAPFAPAEPYVYFEPAAELMAFVFPESFREKEDFWRAKMREDFLTLKEGLGKDDLLAVEPELFFGAEDLGRLLEDEDYRGEEREVMEHLAAELGLSVYRVSPAYARARSVPGSLPYKGKGRATRQSVIQGLETLIAANDLLTSYSEYLSSLKASDENGLPPAAAKPPDAH